MRMRIITRYDVRHLGLCYKRIRLARSSGKVIYMEVRGIKVEMDVSTVYAASKRCGSMNGSAERY